MKFTCPNCQQHLEADDEYGGSTIACPMCGQEIVLPATPSSPVSPPQQPAVSTPRLSAPLPGRRRTGMPGFVSFLLFAGLIAAGAFGYTMYRYQESPRQVWKRIDELLRGKPAPTPAIVRTPVPMPTLAPVPEATPLPEATPVAPVTPDPGPDPIAWLLERKNRWPREVKLLQPQDFPVVMNGKTVGSAVVPAGTSVGVASIEPESVGVVFRGGEKRLPHSATTLPAFAKLEMERPEPTPTPEIAAALAPATATATPFTGFDRDDEESESKSYHRTVNFAVGAPGIDKSIDKWGLDVTWTSSDNLRRGMLYMGEDLDWVRVGFLITAPMENGEYSAAKKAELDGMAELAKLAGKSITMSPGTGSGVDPYFKTSSGVDPERWIETMEFAAKYYRDKWGLKIVSVEPFNEPDYGEWQEGPAENLAEVMKRMRSRPTFKGMGIAGPSCLGVDRAVEWWPKIKRYATEGTTHILGGSFDDYTKFYRDVITSGKYPYNPEVHNVVECIVGADFGLKGCIWWGPAERTRAAFIKACQGKRLGYAEDRKRWTAAAVYRAPDGRVLAFLGSSERTGIPTTYRFVCKDRDVYFDGDGPRREYIVTIEQNLERMIEITWGDKAQKKIDAGTYEIVNRKSGKVLEAADGSTGDGARLQQGRNRHKDYQKWNIAPLVSDNLDQSYFTLRNVHSGKSPDVTNRNLDDGGIIQVFGTGKVDFQHWWFEPAEDGHYYIRSRWSTKYMQPADESRDDGAQIVQWSFTGDRSQQWELKRVGDEPSQGREQTIQTSPFGRSEEQ